MAEWDNPDDLARRALYEAVLARAREVGAPIYNQAGPSVFVLDYHGNRLTYDQKQGPELGRATMEFVEAEEDDRDEPNEHSVRRSPTNPMMFTVGGKGELDVQGVANDIIETFLRHAIRR